MIETTLEELLDREDNWLDRDGLDDEEKDAWIKEGIELYETFMKIDANNSRYLISLARLYLQLGREEKIRRGNHRQAYQLLRKATIYDPSNPNAFYHLSFILAKEKRKWEAVVFYGNEALAKGIEGSLRIKLLSHVALGYARLGYPSKSMELIKEAMSLDTNREHGWFIQLRLDKMKTKISEPILLNDRENSRMTVSKKESEQLKEDALEGKCIVLDLTTTEKYLYGLYDTVRLEPKQAEILGYLIDHQMKSCLKGNIEKEVWLEQEVGPTVVKRHISVIRTKVSKALGRDDVKDSIVITTREGYKWQYDEMPVHILR